MSEFMESTGKTVDEAIREALLRMGLRREEVEVTVLQRDRGGLLGIGRHLFFQHEGQRARQVFLLLGSYVQQLKAHIGARHGEHGVATALCQAGAQAFPGSVVVQPHRFVTGARGIPGEAPVQQAYYR